jgi:tRNA-dihydrouridine synthase A
MDELLDKGGEKRDGDRCWLQPTSHRFSVAPMLDYTDRHFRVLMRQITSYSLLYTEMVVAQALHHARREPGAGKPGGRLERLIGFDPCERPLALQVGGDDPKLLADATRLAADWGYDEINLNVGCPSEKVQRGRFGACLMAEPEQVARCVAAMATASALPVTVKHRIGIDERDSYAELLAFVDTVAGAGCQRFAVHARKAWLEGLDPKQNRTIPPLRHDLVHRLKADRPQLTIELNGGLETLDDCLSQLEKVDGVMVGRAVYDHPLRWAAVDRLIHGTSAAPGGESHLAMAAGVVRGLMPYAERWLGRGERLWPIARHLVKLVEGVPGARRWRQQLTCTAGDRQATVRVLEQAALLLEQGQPSAPP